MLARTFSSHDHYVIASWCMKASENQKFFLNLATITWMSHLVHNEAIAN